MDTKRLVIGTLIGGITLYVTGYLIFELAFGAFYAANAGSATGVVRTPELQWAIAVASLSYAALVSLAIGNRSGSTTLAVGAKVGAVVGFLVWFTADFTLYGITNIQNLTRTTVDPLLEIVHGGVAGAIIAAALKSIAPSQGR